MFGGFEGLLFFMGLNVLRFLGYRVFKGIIVFC